MSTPPYNSEEDALIDPEAVLGGDPLLGNICAGDLNRVGCVGDASLSEDVVDPDTFFAPDPPGTPMDGATPPSHAKGARVQQPVLQLDTATYVSQESNTSRGMRGFAPDSVAPAYAAHTASTSSSLAPAYPAHAASTSLPPPLSSALVRPLGAPSGPPPEPLSGVRRGRDCPTDTDEPLAKRSNASSSLSSLSSLHVRSTNVMAPRHMLPAPPAQPVQPPQPAYSETIATQAKTIAEQSETIAAQTRAITGYAETIASQARAIEDFKAQLEALMATLVGLAERCGADVTTLSRDNHAVAIRALMDKIEHAFTVRPMAPPAPAPALAALPQGVPLGGPLSGPFAPASAPLSVPAASVASTSSSLATSLVPLTPASSVATTPNTPAKCQIVTDDETLELSKDGCIDQGIKTKKVLDMFIETLQGRPRCSENFLMWQHGSPWALRRVQIVAVWDAVRSIRRQRCTPIAIEIALETNPLTLCLALMPGHGKTRDALFIAMVVLPLQSTGIPYALCDVLIAYALYKNGHTVLGSAYGNRASALALLHIVMCEIENHVSACGTLPEWFGRCEHLVGRGSAREASMQTIYNEGPAEGFVPAFTADGTPMTYENGTPAYVRYEPYEATRDWNASDEWGFVQQLWNGLPADERTAAAEAVRRANDLCSSDSATRFHIASQALHRSVVVAKTAVPANLKTRNVIIVISVTFAARILGEELARIRLPQSASSLVFPSTHVRGPARRRMLDAAFEGDGDIFIFLSFDTFGQKEPKPNDQLAELLDAYGDGIDTVTLIADELSVAMGRKGAAEDGYTKTYSKEVIAGIEHLASTVQKFNRAGKTGAVIALDARVRMMDTTWCARFFQLCGTIDRTVHYPDSKRDYMQVVGGIEADGGIAGGKNPVFRSDFPVHIHTRLRSIVNDANVASLPNLEDLMCVGVAFMTHLGRERDAAMMRNAPEMLAFLGVDLWTLLPVSGELRFRCPCCGNKNFTTETQPLYAPGGAICCGTECHRKFTTFRDANPGADATLRQCFDRAYTKEDMVAALLGSKLAQDLSALIAEKLPPITKKLGKGGKQVTPYTGTNNLLVVSDCDEVNLLCFTLLWCKGEPATMWFFELHSDPLAVVDSLDSGDMQRIITFARCEDIYQSVNFQHVLSDMLVWYSDMLPETRTQLHGRIIRTGQRLARIRYVTSARRTNPNEITTICGPSYDVGAAVAYK